MSIKESWVANIKCFILQSNSVSQSTAAYINYYKGLNVYTSFGFGNTAQVTWISFTGEGQTTSEGIFPVLLYYRLRDKLILSYGISATKTPSLNWPKELDIPTIKQYFKDNGNLKGKDINKYQNSLVYKSYDISSIDYDNLIDSIDTLIEYYKDCLEKEGLPRETSYCATGARWRSIQNTFFDFSKIEGKARIAEKDILVETLSPTPTPTPTPTPRPFSIDTVIKTIATSGLMYSPDLVKRFAFSLMAKPFVILSGLAGSGKTQLALAFAETMSFDESQICTVAVGADWTNREPLLGYPSALESDKYIRPDSRVLDFLIDAAANETRPYFLILDEMNLSYVERYFADILSVMESDKKIRLWKGSDSDGTPDSIPLPKNLYIIGTINVDETTYLFSPKVLDRASVIEFKISETDMDDFLGGFKVVDRSKLSSKCADMGNDFVNKSCVAATEPDTVTHDILLEFFKQLKSVNAEFGYRSATEILKFIEIAKNNDDTATILNDDQILDAAIVQKLLPKLHGSKKRLDPVLKQLWSLCGTGCDLDIYASVPATTTYPLSADKILRMYKSACFNSFTSFSEA